MFVHLATACAPNLFESPIYWSVFPAVHFFPFQAPIAVAWDAYSAVNCQGGLVPPYCSVKDGPAPARWVARRQPLSVTYTLPTIPKHNTNPWCSMLLIVMSIQTTTLSMTVQAHVFILFFLAGILQQEKDEEGEEDLTLNDSPFDSLSLTLND